MTTNAISTILASAGTGKTFALTSAIVAAIKQGIPPERILTTTFTVKAAEEVVERARAALVAAGDIEAAIRLVGGRFGTVNAVAGSIVGEFALDLGRSPSVDVIPEESEASIFAIATDAVIAKYAPRLNQLASIFGFADWTYVGPAGDWQTDLRTLIALARASAIAPSRFTESADRSVATFRSLMLPAQPGDDPTQFDTALVNALRSARDVIPVGALGGDSQKAADLVRACCEMLTAERPIPWSTWARLSKAKTTKRDGVPFQTAVETVRARASVHSRHPRLCENVERYIRTLLACAAEALDAYQMFKAERGLVDFTDQEALALEILTRADLRARLSEQVEAVFVDEFQDSSPIQLALFTTLAGIASNSTWVGDPKQVIYGFRKADSRLTQAAARGAAAAAGTTPQFLGKSWRSRPALVDFFNDAVTPAFEAAGMSRPEIRFTGAERPAGDPAIPPLAVWHLEGKNKIEVTTALAAAIAEMLGHRNDWPVGNPDGSVRPLRPGDIAVLCRVNKETIVLADAISAYGLKVAAERPYLMEEPHIELVVAALRWVADASDRLALAEMARLLGGTENPSGWLQAVGADDPVAALHAILPFAAELVALREKVLALTSAEVLDCIIQLRGIVSAIEGWGDVLRRFDDLEALRGLARSFEQTAAQKGQPATLSGLASVLSAEQSAAMRPVGLDPEAISILTYHKAKGLEWPIVVLHDLDQVRDRDLFTPAIETEGEVDWQAPLANRWLRVWPWPYGATKTDVGLDTTSAASDIGLATSARERQEQIRLLYVGMTRARDHLIFAAPVKSGAKWLDLLGAGQVALPQSQGDPIVAGGNSHPARLARFMAPADIPPSSPATVFGASDRPTPSYLPKWIKPSAANAVGQYSVLDRFDIGTRIPITGDPDMERLGDAIHAIFTADHHTEAIAARLEQAARILRRWGVSEIAATSVIQAVEQFNAFIAEKFPGSEYLRESAVHARLGDQIISGRVDALVLWAVDQKRLFAVMDHKSFPGSRDKQEERAIDYAGQLDLYRRGVEVATEGTCAGLFIHMPVVGTVLRVG